MFDTLLVNLFGGPGTRKSTVAAGLFCLLKMHDVESELVIEYAKDLVWEGRYATLKNQQYIFGKQYNRVYRIIGKVEVLITDSPLMLSTVYGTEHTGPNFIKNVVDVTNTFNNNINILLSRPKEYNDIGRYQNRQEAEIIDQKIKQSLSLHKIEWVEIENDYNTINNVTSIIMEKLNRAVKFHISNNKAV